MPNLTPATPEAESETVQDAANLTIPVQQKARMLIRQIFEQAFLYNDDCPRMFTRAQRQELPPYSILYKVGKKMST